MTAIAARSSADQNDSPSVSSWQEIDFNKIVAELLPQLTGYFLRRLGNADDAADAAADVLIVIVRKRDQLQWDAESLRQYGFGVARKVLSRSRRGKIRHTELAEKLRREMIVATPVDPDPHPDLASALAKLSEKDRELLLLVAWEGLPVAEAGAVLRLKPDAARQRYSRLRARLRAELV
ncbi:sigma-70 family RNA polymerase sigma factor [Leucobacter viscericola]|uniref:Sigma-70 family RNA polymerase sigma factor n=1 Tax=Leucobacter viscericola TaxID=2714935 RepID=A0A6G7XIN2_9MICO|nr:sigma-70 family RNA polymerase sigma factor [Leucobacter viscericola]QIK64460.1 sigma-70 family RNA polymerase sigma factor [Leucobacter viscericola]